MENCNITGIGTINGGDYDCLKISGACSCKDEITAKDIKVSGTANFKKNVKADSIKISGAASFNQDIKCKTFHISGAIKIDGNLSADSVTVSGAIQIDGDLNTDVLVVDSKSSKFNGKSLKIFLFDVVLTKNLKRVSLNFSLFFTNSLRKYSPDFPVTPVIKIFLILIPSPVHCCFLISLCLLQQRLLILTQIKL